MPAMPAPAAMGTTTPTGITPRITRTGRFGQGELRRQVAAHLAATHGAHTATAIARALGRSSGAVGNALAKLADAGQATRERGPRAQYRANASTAAAASGMSPAPVATTPARTPERRLPRPPQEPSRPAHHPPQRRPRPPANRARN
jgi:nitric oxide reductase NorQ protein